MYVRTLDGDHSASRAMPGSESNATVAAFVDDIFHAVDHVGNAAAAGEETKTKSPGTVERHELASNSS